MLKSVVATAAVLALAGSSLVYAQGGFGGGGDGFGGGRPRAEHRHRPTADDVAAFADARIAALRAGLELTPEQAKNWPVFEQALHDMVQLRIDRIKTREAAKGSGAANGTPTAPTAPPTPFERMSRRADNMAKFSAALKRVADAGAPLYASLNDAQKSRFRTLARILRPHSRMHARADERGGWRLGRFDHHDRRWFGHEGRRFGDNDRNPGGRPSDDDDGGSQL